MSQDKPEPICSFEKLKEQLTKMGYQIVAGSPYRPIRIKDVDINELKNMEFTDEGIFVLDETDGSRHQVFLYKRRYRLTQYGKPRYHIRKCATIQEFIDSGSFRAEYRRANTNSVQVKDMDNFDTEVTVDNLPLCRNCLNMILRQYGYGSPINQYTTSAEFVELLKLAVPAVSNSDVVDVDIFGYTRDWETISYDFRKKHNFTCEQCGIEIPFDIQYLHSHHRNGMKTDNREENLQCLCIRCHANVNEEHRKQFSSGQRKLMLEEFNKLFPPSEYSEPPQAQLPVVHEYDDETSDDLPF